MPRRRLPSRSTLIAATNPIVKTFFGPSCNSSDKKQMREGKISNANIVAKRFSRRDWSRLDADHDALERRRFTLWVDRAADKHIALGIVHRGVAGFDRGEH